MARPGNKKGVHFFWLTESDKADLISMTRAGKTANEIAEWLGCGVCTVRRHQRLFGLNGIYKNIRYWREEDKNTLIEMYNRNCRAKDIARVVGRTPESVNLMAARLRRAGYITVKKSPGPKINDTFQESCII